VYGELNETSQNKRNKKIALNQALKQHKTEQVCGLPMKLKTIYKFISLIKQGREV
jgi:hypothetical protein